MEGKTSASISMMPAGSYGLPDLQGSMQVDHQQNPHPHQSFTADQLIKIFDFIDEFESVKNSSSGNDRENVVEGGVDGHNGGGRREKKKAPWKRVKWTDKMVKLLITTVSYVGVGSLHLNGGGRGKWKAISKALVERGYRTSPQQCEDKFNDLNKQYKKLIDILGKGTSCKVVETPSLLDSMDLSEKAKEDVRKLLSCKQLFYPELCSYHNGNRLNLPNDEALQQSLMLALKDKYCFEVQGKRPYEPEDLDEEDDDAKRKKQGEEHGVGRMELQNQWIISRSLQLEKKKLQIQEQMMELEKERLKWLSYIEQEDRKLYKMRLENENLKLENLRLEFELKRGEMSADYN